MAEQLRTKITADASGFVRGVNQAATASNKFTRAQGKQSQAFTQLAYALDDAQYGFRGVQNNLQALAVTAGVSGPVVLGLTAVLVAMNHIIENFESANTQFIAAKKNFEELTKVILSSDEQIIRDGKTVQEQNKKNAEQLRKQLEANRTLAYIRKDGVAVYREYTAAEREQREGELAGLDAAIKKNATLIQQAEQRIAYNKRLKQIRDSEDIADYSGPLGFDPEEHLKGAGAGEGIVSDNQNFLFGLLPEPDVLSDEIDDINDVLRELGSPLADLSEEQAKEWMALGDGIKTFAEKTQVYSQAIIGAFESAATGSGSFLGKLASSIMGSLGSILISEGVAAIILGINRNAIAPGSGVASIATGKKTLAAGLVLKAGGLLTSGSAGGGGRGGSRVSASGSRPNARGVDTNSDTGNNQVTFKIKGQDLVGALDYNRNVRNSYIPS